MSSLALLANGIEYVEVSFAFDDIAIAVHPQNDCLGRPLFFYVNQQFLIENYDVKAFAEYLLAKQNCFEITSVDYVNLAQ